MTIGADLQQEWASHKRTRMPRDCEGQEVEEIDLLVLDADANACMSDWFATSGAMDEERWLLLEQCAAQIHQVLPSLSGEATAYFERLAKVCARVLAQRGGA